MLNNEKIQIGVDKPLTLENSDCFWMVTNGEANVFYVRIDDEGNYLTSLKFLYSVKKGELLFSLITGKKESNTRLIVFSNNATLLKVNKNNLFTIDSFFLKSMVDKWILKTSILEPGRSPRVYKAINGYQNILLNNDTIAYPSNGISWGVLEEGEISAFSDDKNISKDIKPVFPVPITNVLWIKAKSDNAKLRIISTREVLQDEIDFMLSLNALQDHFYKKLIENLERQTEEDSERISKKATWEEKELANTLQNIKSIVTSNKSATDYSLKNGTKSNVLFTTCKIVGDKIGIKLEEPKHLESYQNSMTNQLSAIARSSKIRVRKIILRGNWWKHENGHMLAFTEKDKHPVALIQKTSTSYTIEGVSIGEKQIVNNEIAESLDPFAYMFFPGFDESITSIKKLGRFAFRGMTLDVKLLIIAAFAGSLIGLLVPVLSGVMFDDVIPSADRSLHFEIFAIMIIVGVISAGLQLVKGALQLRVETKSSVNMQAGVMDHLLRLPVTFYKKFSSGDLTNRALSINAIRQIVSNTVLTAVLTGAFSFVNLILLFYYNPKLAWVGIGLSFLAVIFMVLMGWLKLKYDRKVSHYQGDLQGFLFEFLSGITKIRITGGEKRIFSLWAGKFSKLKQVCFKSGSYQNFVETFNSSYPLFTSIFFFSVIYYTVTHSDKAAVMLTVGSFVAFITAFNQFLSACLRMCFAFISSLNVVTLYERVKPILEEEPESAEQSIDPGELAGAIEMNSVSFRYNENQPLVLKDVTFKIKPGEMVAFVGASGSGKSTIMRLLLGFEHPEAGSIYYDGDAFDSMNKDMVRKQIGVVLQNGALMSGSIYQNIVGNSELTLDDAWKAAKMAGMEEDIKQMPMEMHTVISEGAGTFSGGQRQRLMIARAIVHKPRLLFMDEATSALDNRTQNIVSESLDKLQATRIIIAHRLSTVKNADRIYVVDKGAIVEEGNYNELMEKDGIFSELAKRQIA